ncbi:MAG: ABC transporter permease [Deltaproteobacteria bacterium]|nr:ABC transporter permease [Deltaproteobacteria bacterium]
MRPLDRKLFRDLGKMKGQMIAVGLVMVCGLAVMIMARSLILSLESTCDVYYIDYRFADVFCDLKRAPNSLHTRLAEISGVAAVDTRVNGALVLDLPGMREPADGIIVSLPDDRPQQLNLLHLRTGRLPEIGSRDEVVVSEAFADAHGFKPGDTIDATIYGSRERVRIVGVALSPEFVFESRAGEALPDHRRFGVFWMNERELADAFDLDGAFNNVVVDLAPGTDTRAVLAELDRLLEPYGGRVAYDRTDHASARLVDDEIKGLRVSALAFPAIFLSIAAFMTSAALTRLIRTQREQIAQLKAFGYSSGEVGLHYLKFVLVVVAAATSVGGILGFLLGGQVVELYHEFYRFPSLVFRPDWPAIFVALAAAAAASFLGVFGAVRQAMKLPPAEGMRPEPPAQFKPAVLERLGLQKLVSPAFRMALRNIERKPWQAFFTTVGLAFATAIPIVPGSFRDGIAYVMDFQWRLAQRQDVTVGLIEPGSASAFSAMQHLPGVFSAEPFRAVAARLRHGHREHRVAVTGLPREVRLNRLLDQRGVPAALPLTGLLLSEELAKVLDATPGDSLRIEVQEGRRPVIEAPLTGTITDFSGVGAYMEINALRRLMREGGTINGAHLSVDRARWDDFLAEVKRSSRIGALTITEALRAGFDETLAEMMGTIQAIYFSFAVIVAFGVVYNGARIALSERSRDLATLRVVGFTNREVAAVLIGELVLLTIIAIPFGLLLGARLAKWILEVSGTETIRFPLILTSRTYATSVLIVLLSSGLSFAVVSRRIRKLDLLGVLKARE